MTLEPEDWKILMDAIENPKPPTPAMLDAVRRYKEVFGSPSVFGQISDMQVREQERERCAKIAENAICGEDDGDCLDEGNAGWNSAMRYIAEQIRTGLNPPAGT
jgi:hypothetical protein